MDAFQKKGSIIEFAVGTRKKRMDKGKQISKWMLSKKEGSTSKFADKIPKKLVGKGSQI